MNQKIALVTGSTEGIGKAIARGLARQDYRVLLAARNPAKAETVLHELRRETGNPALEHYGVDLASQVSIRQLAADVSRQHGHLDVLVNAAGVILNQRQTTVDGLESTFAVNHLAYFLLTSRLMPCCGRVRRPGLSTPVPTL